MFYTSSPQQYVTHHRHFTLVYLFGDNEITVDMETAREPSTYLRYYYEQVKNTNVL